MKTHYAPKLHIIESEHLAAYSRHAGVDAWQPVYLASDVDAREAQGTAVIKAQREKIAELEKALAQIRNGCVDDDDEANELFRASPAELRKIADNALMER